MHPRSGGTWRAFVRHLATQDLREAGRQYRALTADSPVLQACRLEGEAATKRARKGIVTTTSFGPKRRQATEALQRRATEQRIASLADDESTAPLTETIIQEAIANSLPTEQIIKKASSADHALARRRRGADDRDQDSIAAFIAASTQPMRAALHECLPILDPFANLFQCTPAPCPGVVVADYRHEASADSASMLQKLLDKSLCGQTTSLGAACDRDFQRQHQTIGEEEAESDRVRTFPRPSRCWIEGVCVCQGEGLGAWAIRNRILKAVKAKFPQRSANRALLLGRRVVARLTPVVEARDVDPDGQDMLEWWGIQPRYVHIADPKLNPWTLSLSELVEVTSAEELEEVCAFGGELALKAAATIISPCLFEAPFYSLAPLPSYSLSRA